jgi:ligand-binding sensor domain-containing protein
MGIIQDSKGYMWFGTLDGLNKYDGYTITTFQFKPHDTTSIAQNIIYTLYEDTEGLIWIGTTEGGICKFNPFTQVFTTYKPPQSKNQFIPPLRAVCAIVEDKESRIWAANFGGELRCFDKKTSTFSQPYNLGYSPQGEANKPDAFIFSIYKDRAGTLWVGSQTGLHKLSFPSENNRLIPHPNLQITHYQHEASNENSLSNNSVISICEDQKGMLWVGTKGGLNQFDRQTGTFNRYLHDPANLHSLSHNDMWLKSITEDKGGNLWVGTVNGLNRLDTSRREFTRYYHDPVDASTLGNNYINTLYMDQAGNLWIGTDNGISRLDFNQKPFALYGFNPTPSLGLNGKFVRAICEDKLKNLWIGTELGLNHFNTKTGMFTHNRHNPEHLKYFTAEEVNAIIEDSLGTIWVLNLHKLSRFIPSTGEFSPSSGNVDFDNLLKDEYLHSLYQDSGGTLWIGMAIGMYSFNPRTNRFNVYRHDPKNPMG